MVNIMTYFHIQYLRQTVYIRQSWTAWTIVAYFAKKFYLEFTMNEYYFNQHFSLNLKNDNPIPCFIAFVLVFFAAITYVKPVQALSGNY